MAWVAPITWTSALVTVAQFNEQIRDNLNYLLNPNHQQILRDEGGTYQLNNVTTFQDIDSTNLSITLTTHGGPVLVNFSCVVGLNAGDNAYFDIAVDGTRVGAAHTLGLISTASAASTGADIFPSVTLSLLLTGLAAGTYVIRPQWRVASGDLVQINSNSTTHPVIFEAIEV